MTKARKRRETLESASDSNAFDIFDIRITIIHNNFQPNKLNDGKVNDFFGKKRSLLLLHAATSRYKGN